MKFNEKLQILRKEKKLSQEGFAEMLCVSRQAVSKWESGVSYPEMEKMISISEIFGVTLDSLIKDSDLVDDDTNNLSKPYWASWKPHYEYKSKRCLFGIPLVHINIGRGKKKAKGIIAIGLPVALGAISIGLFSFGAVSIGIFTAGALSIGMFSFGACSLASHIAIGRYASGHIAIGEFAKGTKTIIDTSPNHNFSYITEAQVHQLINKEFPDLWKWIINLVTMFFR